jgi:hypothetical protein
MSTEIVEKNQSAPPTKAKFLQVIEMFGAHIASYFESRGAQKIMQDPILMEQLQIMQEDPWLPRPPRLPILMAYDAERLVETMRSRDEPADY